MEMGIKDHWWFIMKRIWLVYPYGNIEGEGGRDSRFTIFGKELSQNGFSICWWTANFSHIEKRFRCKGWKKISINCNFETVLIPSQSYKRNISFRRILFEKKYKNSLKKGFKKCLFKPDLIVVASTGIFNAFEPCYSFSKRNNIPMIYDIMDIPLIENYMKENHKIIAPLAKIIMSLERRREKKFFKCIYGITALGKNQLDYAIRRAYNRPIHTALVYNGNDVTELRNRITSASGSLKINKDEGWIWCIYSGSLGPQYDIETIIECSRICDRNGKKIKFVIAGGGPQASILKEESKSINCLEYVGFLNHDQLADLYSMGDIGLIAIKAFSTCDMPDKFYDYCASGLAILNTLKGEVKDYIEEYELGLQYCAGNPIDLYDKIAILTKDNLIEKYKKNSYKIGDQFDVKTQVSKLTTMIKTILEN